MHLKPLYLIGLLGLVVLAVLSVGYAQNGNSVSPVGSWYGNALLGDPEGLGTPAEVVMMPTFFSDGTLIANDAQEAGLAGFPPHTTAHGTWVKTGPRSVKATFLWFFVTTEGNGSAGTMRVVLTGELDAHSHDKMTGTLHAYFYPSTVNPATNPDGYVIDAGPYEIQDLRRIQ